MIRWSMCVIMCYCVGLVSCQGKSSGSPVEQSPPTVGTILPKNGTSSGGSIVTISGTHFGEHPPEVFFGTEKAVVLESTPFYMKVQTPASPPGIAELKIINENLQTHVQRNAFRFLNPKSNVFIEPSSGLLPSDVPHSSSVTPVDAEGDLDTDIVLGTDKGLVLYRNDGNGYFTIDPLAFMESGRWTISVASADVDHDGDVDLASIRNRFPHGYEIMLLKNDGTGRFIDEIIIFEETAAHVDIPLSGHLSDFNSDGHQDLYIVRGTQDLFFQGNEAGVFTNRTEGVIPKVFQKSGGSAAADVSGDGTADILITERESQDTLFGAECRNFVNETAGSLPILDGISTSPAIGDIDNDGDMDIFIPLEKAMVAGDVPMVEELDSVPVIDVAVVVPVEEIPVPVEEIPAIVVEEEDDVPVPEGEVPIDLALLIDEEDWEAFFDNIDWDNPPEGFEFEIIEDPDVPPDPDEIIVPCDGPVDQYGYQVGCKATRGLKYTEKPEGQNRILINDGRGKFADETLGRLPVDTNNDHAACFADIDGDGDLDLLVAGEPCRILRNEFGLFRDVTTEIMPDYTRDAKNIIPIDVDNDNDLDFILITTDDEVLLYLNS